MLTPAISNNVPSTNPAIASPECGRLIPTNPIMNAAPLKTIDIAK